MTPASAVDGSTDVKERVTGKSGVGVGAAVGAADTGEAVGIDVLRGPWAVVALGIGADLVNRFAVVVTRSGLRDAAMATARTATKPPTTRKCQRRPEFIRSSSPTIRFAV
jgi:hypothetical protein